MSDGTTGKKARRGKGDGSVFRPAYRNRDGGVRESAVWWIQYQRNGERIRESSGSKNRRDAVTLLHQRLTDISRGKPVGPDLARTRFEDLATLISDDYRINGRRSERRLVQSLAHLRRHFAGWSAASIRTDEVSAYTRQRIDQGATNATVNRELAALKRAFRLARISGRVGDTPHIAMLREATPRRGFFEADELQRVCEHLAPDLRPIVQVAYLTGWRVPSEVLTRQWKHVDFKGGFLRLDPGETKNGDGRMFPLTTELRAILEEQRQRTDALEAAEGRIVPWVFWRERGPGVPEAGVRAALFRRAWIRACAAAGLPGRILHDFRRTAVRNLERRGVSRTAAMALVGHKTESIYRRYAIVDESTLREAAAKLDGLLEPGHNPHGRPGRVEPFRSR